MDLEEMEIFDEKTSKEIEDEHRKDMEDAARSIRSRGLMGSKGAATGEEELEQSSSAGKGIMGRLSSVSSMFSRTKINEESSPPTVTANESSSDAAAAPASAAALAMPPIAPQATRLSAPPALAKEPSKQDIVELVATSSDPIELQVHPPSAPPIPSVSAALQESGVRPNTAPPEASTGPIETTAAAMRTPPPAAISNFTAKAAPPAPPPTETSNTTETPSGAATTVNAPNIAQRVVPGLNIVPFEIREPSLGAAVVGQLIILEGSCYVWAATEGVSSQGSLAAAVGTRFDGGMPTSTPLLAGFEGGDAGGGEGAGAGGGLSVSMAQRLCKRTGRVVFVSCDLPEDSQILVAAVEGKVVKLLKAEEESEA